ncbi:hypothetical protein LSTR_LSTR014377 [Laodelphax striatellus]|uniref:DHHA2 domain-containing protein n=1 Tax=Laodelphax striatellus TaxID=195883 RepID=A0A482XN32_LAOST|nr:hypothetical protein LSTR_LSTR014377 [Laodelphax striatellus]
MSCETQLNTFLLKSKKDLENIDEKPCVHVVIGNESCDLDSAVSSITYAYFLSHDVLPESAVIPVINVPKKQFEVKTEVKYFLNLNSITDDMLVFRDDIALLGLHAANQLKLVLVDHHVLQSELAALNAAVTHVIDHRPRVAAASGVATHVHIELVGSCATLVGQRLHEKKLLQQPQIARLVRGTILLDTSNFSPVTKKTTELDRQIVALCEKEADLDCSRQELFDELVAAKTDISSLSTYSLLIKDMKKVFGVPLSVLTMSVKDFLERPDAEASIKEFCTEHEARVLLILGVIVREGSQLRDLFIYPNTCRPLADKIEEYLKASTTPKLDLHMVENKFGGKIFKEINTYSTRKQVLPIVERAIQNYDTETGINS